MTSENYDELSRIPILHELGLLYIQLHNFIRDFEKLERYTLGVSMEKILLECIHDCHRVTAFQNTSHKLAAAVAASAHFDTLKLYIRIGTKIHCISDKQYAILLPRLATIGPMLGGWVREISKN